MQYNRGAMASPFQEGDLVLLIDAKGRRYLQSLGREKVLETHLGYLPHGDIIGCEEGARLATHTGRQLIALRPTMVDYVMAMRRKSNIVYPKDMGPILLYGDIFPGATVLEAGIGSGALTLALLRAVGPAGHVISYDVREDLAKQAMRNVRGFLPHAENHQLRIRDVYQGIEERDLDRVVLDLPEPWQALEPIAEAMRPGGIVVTYLPTVLQLHRLHQALEAGGRFELAESFEVLHRSWHLSPTSARPSHRMVGHTGFLTRAVLCAPRTPPGAEEAGPREDEGDADPAD
ncbi:MAG: tRNA (adenine-N1)-methyltransferase [Dehalococcoidia bacterium]